MPQHRILITSWFQRTIIHLQEVYRYFKHGVPTFEINDPRIVSLRDECFGKGAFVAYKEGIFDGIEAKIGLPAQAGDARFSMTEDGVIMLETTAEDILPAVDALQSTYVEKIGPLLFALFGRGAPLPENLMQKESTYPIIVVSENLTAEAIADLFGQLQDTAYSQFRANGADVWYGSKLIVFNGAAEIFTQDIFEELMRVIVFFRDFRAQLKDYLALHRDLWDALSAIRSTPSMRYKDFPKIRDKLFDYKKTLSFVGARLEQMKDILDVREAKFKDASGWIKMLQDFRIDDFGALGEARNYIADLWTMTVDYNNSTLDFLNILYDENIQRELNVIKMTTLLTAVAGVLGMNIPFPWEERWVSQSSTFYLVMGIVILLSVGLYYILRMAILNRRFALKENAGAELTKK